AGNLTVFFGKNNSGKSSIILGASHHFMNIGHFVMDYIGANRFDTSDNIEPSVRGDISKQEEGRKRRTEYNSNNSENSSIDPIKEYWLQDSLTQEKIKLWIAKNFGEDL